MSKKKKYVPKKGITGMGKDYNVYNLSLVERSVGFLIGFAAGTAAAQIMFGVLPASVVIGIITGIFAVPIFRNYLLKKRKKLLLLQFRDLLDSLCNSFASGKNAKGAFEDSYGDMVLAYGKESDITEEVKIILDGRASKYMFGELLKDLADRSGLDDINSFAETFSVCEELGGNMRKIVTDSRDIINEKIEIEMEIETTLTSNKNEMNIMCVMPFVIIAMMGTLGQSSVTANTPLNVTVKLIAAGMFILAYYIGRKITDIKI